MKLHPPKPSHVLASTAAYCVGYVGLGLMFAVVGPTLSGLAALVDAPLQTVSSIFVGRSAGFLLGALLSSRVYERVPGHPVLAGLLLLAATAIALVPLSSTVATLIAVFALLGFAEGAFDVGGNALLIQSHPKNLAPWMNLLHFAFGLGALIAPLIVAQCFLIDDSIRRPYWILAGLLLPIAGWLLLLKSPPLPRRESKTHTNSNPVKTIILATLLLATSVGVEAGFAGWIAKYAQAMNLAADKSAAAVLTSGFWMAFVVGRLVGIPIAIRVRPSKVLAMDLVGCAIGPLVILLWPTSATALWVGAMIAGFSVASMFAMIFALTAQRLTVTSRVTSYLFVGVCTGGATIPWIIGQLFERVGPQAMLYVILADLMVGFVIFAMLLRCSPGEQASA